MCKLHLITRHLGHLQMEPCAGHLNTLDCASAIMCYLGREGIMAASLCGNISLCFLWSLLSNARLCSCFKLTWTTDVQDQLKLTWCLLPNVISKLFEIWEKTKSFWWLGKSSFFIGSTRCLSMSLAVPEGILKGYSTIEPIFFPLSLLICPGLISMSHNQ